MQGRSKVRMESIEALYRVDEGGRNYSTIESIGESRGRAHGNTGESEGKVYERKRTKCEEAEDGSKRTKCEEEKDEGKRNKESCL